jgi:high affinity Mn2+ porin
MFDLNSYAGSTRLQFENWALWENTAWDFAADTRGYTNGVVVSWFEPGWILRLASAQMPTFANGNVFDGRVLVDRGDEAELTLMPGGYGAIIRLLAYDNHGRMGSYAEALNIARSTGKTPDIVADDKAGRAKYGFGLNVEQPIADSGATGVFARLGWDDGKTESFVFTEVDQHASAGVQVAGSKWARHDDRLGVAFFAHGLSDVHRAYLAAGGVGFLLGDGKLDYGCECGVEAYYRTQIGRWVQVSPDIQHIWNPGYNRDRGPATIVGFRVNARY